MSNQYGGKERQLSEIIKNNIISRDRLRLIIYYKSRRLKDFLIKNSPEIKVPSCVVYRFTCNDVSCSAGNNTYIGYTTQALKQRISQHYYSGAIKLHYQENHGRAISKEEMLINTKVLRRNRNADSLRLIEALLIKDECPLINRKDEGITKTLRIF